MCGARALARVDIAGCVYSFSNSVVACGRSRRDLAPRVGTSTPPPIESQSRSRRAGRTLEPGLASRPTCCPSAAAARAAECHGWGAASSRSFGVAKASPCQRCGSEFGSPAACQSAANCNSAAVLAWSSSDASTRNIAHAVQPRTPLGGVSCRPDSQVIQAESRSATLIESSASAMEFLTMIE